MRQTGVILYLTAMSLAFIRSIVIFGIVKHFFWDALPIQLSVSYILAGFLGNLKSALFAANFFFFVLGLRVRFEKLRVCLR